jgi:hypothetical protein
MSKWRRQLPSTWWMLAVTLAAGLVSAAALAGFSIGRLI